MSAKETRKLAWSKLQGNWGTAIGIAVLFMLVSGAVAGVPGLGALVSIAVTGPLTVGLYVSFLKLQRGAKPEIGDLFSGFNDFLNGFVLYLLNEIFTFLWSLLFIVPGIIKSLSYSMSYYVLAENPGMDQDAARRRSMELMEGNKWRLFCLRFSFIGWVLLSGLTGGILLIMVVPYMQAADAEFYRSLVRVPDFEPLGEEPFEPIEF